VLDNIKAASKSSGCKRTSAGTHLLHCEKLCTLYFRAHKLGANFFETSVEFRSDICNGSEDVALILRLCSPRGP